MIKLRSVWLMVPAFLLVLPGCDWDSQAAGLDEPYLHQATTQIVNLQPSFHIEREFAGEIQAGQSSQLAFEFPGQVQELMVDEGDAVVAGQALARLDTRLLESERNELTAQLAELQAELETNQRNLARAEQLQADRLVSQRERDDLAGRVLGLEASLQRVEAALQANRVRFDMAELKAPFAAGIAERFIDEGTVVSAGTPVFELVQSQAREVQAGVPVSVAQNLEVGDQIPVRVGDRETLGRLVALGPVVDQSTRSRSLRVVVEENWSPGELAYLLIEVPMATPGAWLPDTAVTEGVRGTWVVYVAVPDGDAEARLEARTVVIHHVRGNRLFVSGALSDGEQVVAAGLHRLAPKQRVRTQSLELIADARPID